MLNKCILGRLVALENDGHFFDPKNKADVEASFADVYAKLVVEAPITCAVTGITYDALPHPIVAVLDVSHSSSSMRTCTYSI